MSYYLSVKSDNESKSEPLEEEYEKWDLQAVLQWLDDNDFGEYKQNFSGDYFSWPWTDFSGRLELLTCPFPFFFEDNNIHGRTFFELTHKALKNLNIPTITERVRLLNATKKIGLHRTRKDRRDSVQINTEPHADSDHETTLQLELTPDYDSRHAKRPPTSSIPQPHQYRNSPRETTQPYQEHYYPNMNHGSYTTYENPMNSRDAASAHGYRDLYATYRDYQSASRDSFVADGHPVYQAPIIRPRGSSKDYFQNPNMSGFSTVSPVSSLTAQNSAATIAITPRSSSRNIRFFSSSPGSPVSNIDSSSTLNEYPPIPPRGESLGHWRSKNSPVNASFPT
ncbi:hypothetical protein K493DRAFT_303440 [Basidiobolus meristosporus CBS 931.73]|uniref:SAM domain-containing protein n=1 Tax=Basidiobolus meristosporus CBS 931.73 TaxID=1314790 RepID=A0A1Y1Y2N1_9FUNG|nr:hypothetical protein K493DRAFT_303440 [Basidiobolus meristosporus CBS 931.73]|eukprot:ORX92271.1 hypothetical protein K493DRAFT_303440 [Basidiobolus meristosporus CBS 931.73]